MTVIAGTQVACGGAAPEPAAPRAPVELRFERLASGHILVPLEVDGLAGQLFIVDTGASATVMTRKAIAEAGLVEVQGGEGAIGADGVATQSASYRIGRLRAGAVEHAELTVVEVSLEPLGDDRIAGVLGRDFLSRHRVEIDLAAGIMRLRDLRSPPPPPRGTRLSFQDLSEGLIGLDVRLNGAGPLRAVFDLGAGVSIINQKAAALAGVTVSEVGGIPAVGVGGNAAMLVPQRFDEIEVGGVSLTGHTLYVGDLPAFEVLGLGDEPAMLFGLDLLADGVVEIDYQRRELVLPLAPAD